MSLPLPGAVAHFLGFSGEVPQSLVNRSLLFDRGMDRYGADFKIPPEGREGFLGDFARAFRACPPKDYPAVLRRREQALEALGARSVQRFARTRLVVGLGLPHPTETGFLFDRITGCPYLPGSSVKGLLRAAARLAAAGELDAGDAWTEADVRRIFGPELGGGWTPQTGSVVFYDAFPTEWPRLEVDILTPHHRDHNDRKDAPAADWDEPNPVPFLTVAPGAAFRFFLGPGEPAAFEKDLPRLATLLDVALDLLAIGAKKAAGHGVFGKEAPALQAAPAPPVAPGPRRIDPPPPPPPPAPSTLKETVWKDAELVLHRGSPAVSRGKQLVPCSWDVLSAEALEALKRDKAIRADIVVIKLSGGGFRPDRLQSWRTR